jgi:hypothetical protein
MRLAGSVNYLGLPVGERAIQSGVSNRTRAHYCSWVQGALGAGEMLDRLPRRQCGINRDHNSEYDFIRPRLRFTVRHRNMKDRATRMVVGYPNVSTMGFNDGLANGKPYSGAGGFC